MTMIISQIFMTTIPQISLSISPAKKHFCKCFFFYFKNKTNNHYTRRIKQIRWEETTKTWSGSMAEWLGCQT